MNNDDTGTGKTVIERLVTSFKSLPGAQRRGMNEMQTRLSYILTLFRPLGWVTSNINEVSPEEKVSRGSVDFSFRIGNVPRFFLETRKIKEHLNDARWGKQSIDYAWTREQNLDRLRTLKRQIAQVDLEIEQRAYALYGLTEEEIKIVKSKKYQYSH